MTDEQIKRITELREQGIGYGKISQILDISQNTVKSFCQRNNLGGMRFPAADADIHVCKFCGKEVHQNPGRKEKKFCDDKCRMAYWNSHQDKVERKAIYEYTCPYCGKPFTAYGNANRRYCSRICYFTARFGYRDYWSKKYEEKPVFTAEMSG